MHRCPGGCREETFFSAYDGTYVFEIWVTSQFPTIFKVMQPTPRTGKIAPVVRLGSTVAEQTFGDKEMIQSALNFWNMYVSDPFASFISFKIARRVKKWCNIPQPPLILFSWYRGWIQDRPEKWITALNSHAKLSAERNLNLHLKTSSKTVMKD